MRIVTFSFLAALFFSVAGCNSEPENPRAEEAISKELFIEAYVKLRMEGLRSPMMEISLEDRDQVLEEVGVTEEELLTFVEVWGADGEFMVEVWGTIDSLMMDARMDARGGRDRGDEEDPGESAIDFRGAGGR